MCRRVSIDDHPARTPTDDPACSDDHRAEGLVPTLDGESFEVQGQSHEHIPIGRA
jgi:hypothetical protein